MTAARYADQLGVLCGSAQELGGPATPAEKGPMMSATLEHLEPIEADCLWRFIGALSARLGSNLVEVRLFGSAARGDISRKGSQLTSDIDVLVLTRKALPNDLQEALVNETYQLYLECGRQIAPQWRSADEWATPADERARFFKEAVEKEGRALYPEPPNSRLQRTRVAPSARRRADEPQGR